MRIDYGRLSKQLLLLGGTSIAATASAQYYIMENATIWWQTPEIFLGRDQYGNNASPSLTLLTGAYTGPIRAHNGSQIFHQGGQAQSMVLFDTVQLTMSDGLIVDYVSAVGHSNVTVSGGTVGSGISASGSATVTVSGGTVGGIGCTIGSTVTVTDGLVGGLVVNGTGNLIGGLVDLLRVGADGVLTMTGGEAGNLETSGGTFTMSAGAITDGARFTTSGQYAGPNKAFLSGGSLKGPTSFRDASKTYLQGASMTGDGEMRESAELRVSGGTFEGDFRMYDKSFLDLSGGNFAAQILMKNTAFASFSGGAESADFDLRDESQLLGKDTAVHSIFAENLSAAGLTGVAVTNGVFLTDSARLSLTNGSVEDGLRMYKSSYAVLQGSLIDTVEMDGGLLIMKSGEITGSLVLNKSATAQIDGGDVVGATSLIGASTLTIGAASVNGITATDRSRVLIAGVNTIGGKVNGAVELSGEARLRVSNGLVAGTVTAADRTSVQVSDLGLILGDTYLSGSATLSLAGAESAVAGVVASGSSRADLGGGRARYLETDGNAVATINGAEIDNDVLASENSYVGFRSGTVGAGIVAQDDSRLDLGDGEVSGNVELRDRASAYLQSPTVGGDLVAGGQAVASMDGGSLVGARASDDASLLLRGGTASGSVFSAGRSYVALDGITVEGSVFASGFSHVDVSAGRVVGNLFARDFATITWTGGDIDDDSLPGLYLSGDASLGIYGKGLSFDMGDPMVDGYTTSVLRGRLDDGLDVSGKKIFLRIGSNARFGLFNTVPEPSTWAAMAFGLAVLARRRRRA